MEPINEILKSLSLPALDRQEVLASLSEIELTADEITDALIWAKQRKQAAVKEQQLSERIEENRKHLTGKQWDYNQTKLYMQHRIKTIFDGKFLLDDQNIFVFELLCHYFSNSEMFPEIATEMGVKNPSLAKGILLRGVVGTGKTWMMKLFMKNQRQTYRMHHAKDVARSFSAKEEQNRIDEFVTLFKNPINDSSTLLQKYSGLCIDDIATEDLVNDYGNKRNVVGDVIELRYAKGTTGVWFHATTNIDVDDMENFYGARAMDRMKEVFNFIDMPGTSRRK